MRSILVVLTVIVISLSSCSVSRYIAPPFTDVSKILRLKSGMSMNQVTDILKIPPYDVVHVYETGNQIMVYNYRVKDRTAPVPTRLGERAVHGEDLQTTGETRYNNNYKELFLLFKHDTLASVFGERTFLEGTYLERINQSVVSGVKNDELDNVDNSTIEGLLAERAAYTRDISLKEDETTKKRRKLLAKFGPIALAFLLGVGVSQ